MGRYVMDGVTHGFLRKAGSQPVTLDVVPEATDTEPAGISPSGEIMGLGDVHRRRRDKDARVSP